jgi:hypothetical protein
MERRKKVVDMREGCTPPKKQVEEGREEEINCSLGLWAGEEEEGREGGREGGKVVVVALVCVCVFQCVCRSLESSILYNYSPLFSVSCFFFTCPEIDDHVKDKDEDEDEDDGMWHLFIANNSFCSSD